MDNGDAAPPLTPADRCRALVAEARAATLSTIARDPAGFPYGSLVTVAADARGRPILLLSTLAEHTQNLAERGEASLLFVEPAPLDRSPLSLARVTLLGRAARVADEERAEAKRSFLAAHPDAARYADFKDFAFYRLDPSALRFVGGFGRMSWVSAEDYLMAKAPSVTSR